jgi:hypothetical protein
LKSLKFSKILFFEPESYAPEKNPIYAGCLLKIGEYFSETQKKSNGVVPFIQNEESKNSIEKSNFELENHDGTSRILNNAAGMNIV